MNDDGGSQGNTEAVAMFDKDKEMRHDVGEAVATSKPLWQRFVSIGEGAAMAWV